MARSLADHGSSVGARGGEAPDPGARDGACGVAEGQRDHSRSGSRPKSLYPVIESLTGQGINIRHASRVLRVSESGYYAWKDRPPSAIALRRLWLAGEITQVHRVSRGVYGAGRVTASRTSDGDRRRSALTGRSGDTPRARLGMDRYRAV